MRRWGSLQVLAGSVSRGRRWSVTAGVLFVVTFTALFSLYLWPTTVAEAHGTMESPLSRIYQCRFVESPENPSSAACRDAVAIGGTQPLYDWNEVNIGDAAGNHRQRIPDGRLCSAGRDKYRGFDQARADWPATQVTAGALVRLPVPGLGASPRHHRALRHPRRVPSDPAAALGRPGGHAVPEDHGARARRRVRRHGEHAFGQERTASHLCDLAAFGQPRGVLLMLRCRLWRRRRGASNSPGADEAGADRWWPAHTNRSWATPFPSVVVRTMRRGRAVARGPVAHVEQQNLAVLDVLLDGAHSRWPRRG